MCDLCTNIVTCTKSLSLSDLVCPYAYNSDVLCLCLSRHLEFYIYFCEEPVNHFICL